MGRRKSKEELLSVFGPKFDLHKIDPDTNLVELPDQYFWRIEWDGKYVCLLLMYRHTGHYFWSGAPGKVSDIELYNIPMLESKVDEGVEGIRWECRYLLKQLMPKTHPYSWIIGDYPPKRLDDDA